MRRALAVVAALLLLAASACGDSVPDATAPDYEPTASDFLDLGFWELSADCIRQAGHELWPDPVVDDDGVPRWPAAQVQLAIESTPEDVRQAAADVCRPMFDTAARLFLEQNGERLHELRLEVAACLNEKGLTVSEPVRIASFDEDPFQGEVDYDDEAVLEIYESCDDNLYAEFLP